MSTKMTEDELLTGLTEAMTLSGWRWRHARRDDLAKVQGYSGLPDLIAVSRTRHAMIAWELKAEAGVVSIDQGEWIASFRQVRTVHAGILRPADYESALGVILGRNLEGGSMVMPRCVIGDCEDAPVRMLDRNRGLCARHDS